MIIGLLILGSLIGMLAAVVALITGQSLVAAITMKWSQKTGQLAKVYPEPLKGYENGEAPEVYRPV